MCIVNLFVSGLNGVIFRNRYSECAFSKYNQILQVVCFLVHLPTQTSHVLKAGGTPIIWRHAACVICKGLYENDHNYLFESSNISLT